jgi:hypothetical protein
MADKPTNVDPEALAELIAAGPTIIKESKAGYKTTEFWVTLLGSLAVVLNGVPVPEKYEGIVIAVFGAAYILSRGVAKKGIPSIEAPPEA